MTLILIAVSSVALPILGFLILLDSAYAEKGWQALRYFIRALRFPFGGTLYLMQMLLGVLWGNLSWRRALYMPRHLAA